jgi:hypothetical protein
MASVTKREGRANPWQVRYRDPAGQSKSRQFARKVDAERFLITVEADKLLPAPLIAARRRGKLPTWLP